MTHHLIAKGIRKVKRGLERIALEIKATGSWDDIDVTFLISTGRTGTQFLARFFSENFGNVDARHEPHPDMFYLGTKYVRSHISFNDAVKDFKYLRQNICNEVHRKGSEHYIESNNNLAYLIPIIQELYTNYKIVHIIRDGRDFVRSVYSRRIERSSDGKSVLVMSEEDHRKRLQAIDFKNDAYSNQWINMSRIERITWYWAKINHLILDSATNGESRIIVKYEDIFDRNSNYKGMWRIIDFLGLREKMTINQEEFKGKMQCKINRSKQYTLPYWENWSDEQKGQFIRIAGELMERFGYKIEEA